MTSSTAPNAIVGTLALLLSTLACWFVVEAKETTPLQPTTDRFDRSLAERTDSSDERRSDDAWISFSEMPGVCGSCHSTGDQPYIGDDPGHLLNQRMTISRAEWAGDLDVKGNCGGCHLLVDPNAIEKRRWPDVISHMKVVFSMKKWPVKFQDSVWLDLLHYYATGASNFAVLPPDPVVSGLSFAVQPIGYPPHRPNFPRISNVRVTDLDRDDAPDILVSDMVTKSLSWIRMVDTVWVEKYLHIGGVPAKAEPVDMNGDGHLDILYSVIGNPMPTDDRVGSIELLMNDGTMRFTSRTILDSIGRVADARPADFDGDGDIDIVVAVFGFMLTGEVGWLEQKDDGEFDYHRLIRKAGGIHVIPTDINGDGLLDIVALVAQEHEEIIALMNEGEGEFEQKLIYKAFSPSYGFSGIDLADLDGDGDLDIIASNGDAVDVPSGMILPYHGVQWLENLGDMSYKHHSIFGFYGAYRALPGDLDGDGDLDIAVVTMLTEWFDPTRMSAIWLENDGTTHFTPHGISNTPSYLMTADLGDLDGDGDLDMVTGGMHILSDPFQRIGRVTMFENLGKMERESE